jgi:hypothetical protein
MMLVYWSRYNAGISHDCMSRIVQVYCMFEHPDYSSKQVESGEEFGFNFRLSEEGGSLGRVQPKGKNILCCTVGTY